MNVTKTVFSRATMRAADGTVSCVLHSDSIVPSRVSNDAKNPQMIVFHAF